MKIKIFFLSLIASMLFIFSCSQPITEVGSYVDIEEHKRKQNEVVIEEFPATKGGINWLSDTTPIIALSNPRQYKRPKKLTLYKTFEVWQNVYSSGSHNWPNSNNMIGSYRVLSWRYNPNWPIRWTHDGPNYWQGHWERYNYAFAVNDTSWEHVSNYYHDMGHIAPTVIKMGGKYLMYFTKYVRLYNKAEEYRAYTNQYTVEYRSSDNAINWNKQTLTLFNDTTSPHLQNIKGGQAIYSVREYDGKLRLWYGGVDKIEKDGKWRYFYAQSKNLAETEVITVESQTTGALLQTLDISLKGFDSKEMGKSTVLRHNNKYNMWYTGYDGYTYRIGYASSPNGINNWSKRGAHIMEGTVGKFDSDGVADPFVIHEDGIYKMWYAGYNQTTNRWQIGLRYSHDGINFSYYDQNNYSPLELLGIETANYDIRYPTVIRDGGKYKIWFSYRDPNIKVGNLQLPDRWQIGYAESDIK